MKSIYKIVFMFVMCLSWSLTDVSAQKNDPKELEIGIFTFPPFAVIEEGKEPSGILIDYIKPILERCNIKYSIKGYPPKRLYKYLADGEADISLGVKGVPELEGNVLYSSDKITDIDLRVYSRADTPPIKTKEDMHGKRIITIRGYSYGGFIKYIENPATKIVADMTNGHELAFKKLQAQRADYVLDYSLPSEKALKSIIIPNIQSHSISLLEVFFIVSKKSPDAENLLKKLEQAFIELKQEGNVFNM
ncbi:MAG: transporter substrate-binding domain-containing protein [Desulfamplus sp.]|nr:transporter substrate-binding domain-containing protein [Desulfamplus sp.]